MKKPMLNSLIFQSVFALAALPLLGILVLSVLNADQPGPSVSLNGYSELFTWLRIGELVRITGRSVMIALTSTAFAFGLALTLYRSVSEKLHPMLLLLITLPFLVNEAVRIFAWQYVLQENGLFNRLLSLISFHQVSFFNATNSWNVFLVMLLNCIPFGVFIFSASFKTFPLIYLRAADDLKLSTAVRLFKVIIPFSAASFLASFLVIFFIAFSMSTEVNFLGGDTKISTRNLINSLMSASKFQAIFAIGALIIICILASYFLFRHIQYRYGRL
jgi:ABC-type spermidine/putrescine transport system permease subunit I